MLLGGQDDHKNLMIVMVGQLLKNFLLSLIHENEMYTHETILTNIYLEIK